MAMLGNYRDSLYFFTTNFGWPTSPRHAAASTSGHSAASSGAPMRARWARLCAAKAQAKGVEVSNGRAKRKAPPERMVDHLQPLLGCARKLVNG